MALAAGKVSVGRDESYWLPLVDSLPAWEPTPSDDWLLLAPHPDDEVLGCGGLLQRWARHANHAEIWMVTSGEACFGEARPAAEIAARRRDEACEAHRRLAIEVPLRWLAFPDSKVKQHAHKLRRLLEARIDKNTVLIAPLSHDGHPDHDVIGSVCRELAHRNQLLLLQYPIWLWHWGSVTDLQANHVVKLPLTAAEEIRKREAIATFSSQIEPEVGEAILPRLVLRHFRRSCEVLFVEDFRNSQR